MRPSLYLLRFPLLPQALQKLACGTGATVPSSRLAPSPAVGSVYLSEGPPAALLDSDFMALLLVCAIMFLGALAAGLAPLAMRVSEANLRLSGATGAGLLIGTALAVVIPEGFEAFHTAVDDSLGDITQLPDSTMGGALLAGFLAMLVLDHVQGHRGHLEDAGAGHDSDGEASGDAADLEAQYRNPAENPTINPTETLLAGSRSPKADAGSRALIGLLVHSAADGVAVGAASYSGNAPLELIVGLAMVVHKLPAAFGLATFLLGARWPARSARRALVLFAASAPLAAVLTFGLLAATQLRSQQTVALWLLFSGGTFLYAATIHVLPHVTSHKRLTVRELLAVVVGCLLPLALQLGFGHHH